VGLRWGVPCCWPQAPVTAHAPPPASTAAGCAPGSTPSHANVPCCSSSCSTVGASIAGALAPALLLLQPCAPPPPPQPLLLPDAERPRAPRPPPLSGSALPVAGLVARRASTLPCLPALGSCAAAAGLLPCSSRRSPACGCRQCCRSCTRRLRGGGSAASAASSVRAAAVGDGSPGLHERSTSCSAAKASAAAAASASRDLPVSCRQGSRMRARRQAGGSGAPACLRDTLPCRA
jgi:hypothetical protein